MERTFRLAAVGALLLVAAFASSLAFYQGARVQAAVDQLMKEHKEQMAKMTTTWTSALGEHEVVTTRSDGESDAEHTARHKAAVVAAQADFPKID